MKCVNCGRKTEEGKLLCSKCIKIDYYTQFVASHTCNSFFQKEGEMEGVCQNAIVCEPMKNALQGQPLIVPQLGHVTCPHPSLNVSYLVHGRFDRETLKRNYKEYLD